MRVCLYMGRFVSHGHLVATSEDGLDSVFADSDSWPVFRRFFEDCQPDEDWWVYWNSLIMDAYHWDGSGSDLSFGGEVFVHNVDWFKKIDTLIYNGYIITLWGLASKTLYHNFVTVLGVGGVFVGIVSRTLSIRPSPQLARLLLVNSELNWEVSGI